MKFLVDVERKLYCIKTIEVEAESLENAVESAMEKATTSIWDMGNSKINFGVIHAGIIN
jgi:hypothetical protein